MKFNLRNLRNHGKRHGQEFGQNYLVLPTGVTEKFFAICHGKLPKLAPFFTNWPKKKVTGQVSTKLARIGQLFQKWPIWKMTGQLVFQLARFELFGHKLAHLATLRGKPVQPKCPERYRNRNCFGEKKCLRPSAWYYNKISSFFNPSYNIFCNWFELNWLNIGNWVKCSIF